MIRRAQASIHPHQTREYETMSTMKRFAIAMLLLALPMGAVADTLPAGKDTEDLYRTAHPDKKISPGLTCGDSRIDYIFYNKHCSAVSSQVVKHGVFGSLGYEHSDHLAVSGVLEIKGSRTSSAK